VAEVYSGRKLRLISKHFIFIYSNCIAQFGEYLYTFKLFFQVNNFDRGSIHDNVFALLCAVVFWYWVDL
jgi:hypothetical protein